ncbi:MAG: hypothetical protein U9R25_03055 [Chloroflexota bacterium]|nr:hypothetical protein [Chloroflexota bacterium]
MKRLRDLFASVLVLAGLVIAPPDAWQALSPALQARSVQPISPAAIHTATVFVISFPGFGTPRDDIDALTAELIGLFKRGSMYHGYNDPWTEPYLAYEVYGGLVVEDPVLPLVLPNGMADYSNIYERYDLCPLIASGEVDEVWIWIAGGNGIDLAHFGEWVTTGPGWPGGFWPTPQMVNAPDCGQIVTTMAFNYEREVDVALESFVHRLEGFSMTYFPCDFYTHTWPWTGAPAVCTGLVSDRYGYVARPFAGNNDVGGCGDAHHPPNILDDREYIYDDLTVVQSTCRDWGQDGSAQVSSVNCTAWQCTHWGYHVWWMQNLPGYANTNRDRNGDLHPNWWAWIFGPCYDFNGSGDVGIGDVQAVASHWGMVATYPGWNPHLDLDQDRDVDVFDIATVAAEWAQRCPN